MLTLRLATAPHADLVFADGPAGAQTGKRDAAVAAAPPVVNNPAPPDPAVYTTDSLPEQGVVVPFKLELGQIIVEANLAGVSASCVLDTGSPNTEWPLWLDLPDDGDPGHAPAAFSMGASAPSRPAILPFIRLGAFEACRVSTLAVQTGLKDKRDIGTSTKVLDHTAILNCAVFEGTVLTIDYEHSRLVIRPRHFDPATLVNKQVDGVADPAPNPGETPGVGTTSRGYVIGFRFTPSGGGASGGVPVVRCLYDGALISMVLDTGWTDPDAIALNASQVISAYGRHHAATTPVDVQQVQLRTPYGVPISVNRITELPFTFYRVENIFSTSAGDVEIGTPVGSCLTKAEAIWPFSSDSAGAVGESILMRYKSVTIDFERHHVVLGR